MADHAPKVLYLTNTPAPYREKMHELLANNGMIKYLVVYCAKIEPNRHWEFKNGDYHKVYLKQKSKSFIHNNLSVFKYLHKYKPDVVIATAYNPTMLYAFAWCVIFRKKFIPFTDGTRFSESTLSAVHKIIRKIVFRFSDSFITPGKGGIELFESYGISAENVFISCLCVENYKYQSNHSQPKRFDVMFSGQLIDRKMPFFFIEVAKRITTELGACKVLILGDGPLRENVLLTLDEYKIDYSYPGFVQQDSLPAYYNQSKVFLFPTQSDPWGIVVNEACASGTPVITCTNAGSANDLIINDYNGYILPLECEIWVNAICKLLTNEQLLNQFSANAIRSVDKYNSQNAAKGILDAITTAVYD